MVFLSIWALNMKSNHELCPMLNTGLISEQLPKQAEILFFPSINSLESYETTILNELSEFLNTWQTHGKELTALTGIAANHFVWVAVNKEITLPSGCSLDSLYNKIKSLENSLGISLNDRQHIFFQDEHQHVISLPFHKLGEAYKQGSISENLDCFNLYATSTEHFKNQFIIPFKDSVYFRLV